MPLYAVRYTYDERADVRDRFRPEHRDYLATLVDRGLLLGSGPFADSEQPGALLVFRADDAAAVQAAIDADPFTREALIAAAEIRPWDLVIGPWATA